MHIARGRDWTKMADGEREVFQIRALQKVYGEGPLAVRALDGVDLDLYRGELVVLLGPSGSGKSTFLNILGGLDRPSGGEVRFEGRSLGALDERALTRLTPRPGTARHA
jgi:putative ABC transport system ATP-binding protein